MVSVTQLLLKLRYLLKLLLLDRLPSPDRPLG